MTEEEVKAETRYAADSTIRLSEYFRIIALVNTLSGAKKGWELVKTFGRYAISIYNPVDLSLSGTMRQKLGRELLRYQGHCLVLICGGDGSNGWSVSLIEQSLASIEEQRRDAPFPVVIPFPMGTGNDLSRVLGWGHIGVAGDAKILDALGDILFAAQSGDRWSKLDRWTVSFDSNQPSLSLPSQFVCYLSIRYDALIAHRFEEARRRNPSRFTSQSMNQAVYAKEGVKHLFRPCTPITEYVEVRIGDRTVALPPNCRSLKAMNINSAANGVFFWGAEPSTRSEAEQQCVPHLDDGILEVMATTGVGQLVKCRTTRAHAHRMAQTNRLTIRIKGIPPRSEGIALQIDGEAFIVKEKCTLRISLCDRLPTLVGFKQPRGVQARFMERAKDGEKMRKSFKDLLKSSAF